MIGVSLGRCRSQSIVVALFSGYASVVKRVALNVDSYDWEFHAHGNQPAYWGRLTGLLFSCFSTLSKSMAMHVQHIPHALSLLIPYPSVVHGS